MAETALHFGYIVQTIINSIDMDNLEEGIDKLRAFIPDTTLVAALDAVDRDRGRHPSSSDRLLIH